jgi:hypothetical protein
MKAFPTPTFSINNEARVTAVGGEGGMELRDYFAAQALQGILNQSDAFWAGAAPLAYRYADSMLKAREQ